MATINSSTGRVTVEEANDASERQLVGNVKVTVTLNGKTGSASAPVYQDSAQEVNLIIVTDGSAVSWNGYVTIDGKYSYDRNFYSGTTRYEYAGVTDFCTCTSSSTNNSNIVSHIKEIYVFGKYKTLSFAGIAPNVLDVSQLDTSEMTSFENMFLEVTFPETDVDLSNFDTSIVTSTYAMFCLSNVTTVTGLKGFESLESMSGMFYNCPKFTYVDISEWDTSMCTDFSRVFYGCSSLTDISFLSTLDTSGGVDFSEMFDEASNIESLEPLKEWDVSSGENFYSMFDGLHVTSLSGLEDWDMSSATNIGSMFQSCSRLTDLEPLTNWNVSKVTSIYDIFTNCSNLVDISGLASWNTSSCERFAGAFKGCSSLVDVSPIASWNVSKGTDFEEMFSNCRNMTTMAFDDWDLVSCTGSVRFGSIFYNDYNLTTVTGSIKNIMTNLDLSYPRLTRDSALVFINGLASISSARTITFSSSTKNALTDEDIAIATSKGWTVA